MEALHIWSILHMFCMGWEYLEEIMSTKSIVYTYVHCGGEFYADIYLLKIPPPQDIGMLCMKYAAQSVRQWCGQNRTEPLMVISDSC